MILEFVLLFYLVPVDSSSPDNASNINYAEQDDVRNQTVNFQAQLINDKLLSYGGSVLFTRPVFSTDTVTNVTYRLLVHELIELDARNQRITISALLKQKWKDEFFQWSQSDYGGIKVIQLPSDIMWVPDITLHRNIDVEFERIKNTRASVASDGSVTWLAPAIFTSSCRINVRYFPFDTQICKLRFGSWVYTGLEIDLYPETGADAKQERYMDNGVWDLQEVRTERELRKYACCPERTPELVFTLILKRRSSFYVAYLIIPCVFLSGLSLLVFYLPPECGEKLTLSITNLLALVVFQQLIAESMPPSGDDPPLLGDYFLAMITMVCLSVFTTVCVIRVSAESGSVPHWVQWLFLRVLARLTCMHRDDLAFSPPAEQVRNSSTLECAIKLIMPEQHEHQNGCLDTSVSDDLRFIRRDMEERNNEELRLSQWKHVARVIDRCLLMIFLVYAVVTSVVLIWRAAGPEDLSENVHE